MPRATAIFLSLAMLSLSIGIPLPRPMPQKDDEDFPCRYHACGCLTAEMCRTHCCCHLKPGSQPKKVAACCQKKKTETSSCCKTKNKTCQKTDDTQKSSRGSEIIISALQCNGISLGLAALAPFIPPHDELIVSLSSNVGEKIEPSYNAMFSLTDIQPVTPPPRTA